MGLVKISAQMHADLRTASEAYHRSINAQAEYWMKLGMLAELHPQLTHQELARLLLTEQGQELSLQQWLARLSSTQTKEVA